MEKQPITKFDLEAAFKALDEIEVPAVEGGIIANKPAVLFEDIKRADKTSLLLEDYYDLGSNEDLEQAKEDREAEVAKAKLAKIEKIVDLDAETEDDIQPSYVGKVIIQCPQCMTLFYKNPEDIEYSEENPDVVNINETCQHCGNNSGYTLIGKVDNVSEEEADKYEGGEEAAEEDDLDLDFGEPTEEVDAEGTGEAEVDEEDAFDLDIEEEPEEEAEEEVKESLNEDAESDAEEEVEETAEAETLGELVDELTVAEEETPVEFKPVETPEGEELEVKGLEIETEEDPEKVVISVDVEAKEEGSEEANEEAAEEEKEEEEEPVEESLNASEEQKDAEEGSELKTENESENLTLNEETVNEGVDKDLDAKLKAHNDYIAYLQQMIKQEEEALAKADNEEVKAAIQRRLDAFEQDLKDALPEAVKEEAEVEELPTPEEAGAEEVKEEEKVEESLNESLNNSEVQAEAKEESELATENESEEKTLNEDVSEIESALTQFCNSLDESCEGEECKECKEDLSTEMKLAEYEASLPESCAEGKDCKEEVCPKCGKAPCECESLKEASASEFEVSDADFHKMINSQSFKDFSEELEEHINEEHPAIESEQEYQGVDNQVVPCETELLMTHSEDEKPLDCKMEKPALEEPVAGEQIDVKITEDTLTESPSDICNMAVYKDVINRIEHAGESAVEEDLEDKHDETAEKEETDSAEEVDKVIKTWESLEDLHEASLDDHISDYLTEVYSNVDSFQTTACSQEDNKLIVEGNILFKSGNSRKTTFEFTENKEAEKENASQVIYEGLNKDFADAPAFTLKGIAEENGKILVTESFGYKYTINNTLVEGLK